MTTAPAIDESRPFHPHHWDALWALVPVRSVALEGLIWSQGTLTVESLARARGYVPNWEGGDVYAHVVHYDGRHYLTDGHHRVMIALILGVTHIAARLLEVPNIKAVTD